MSSFNEHDLIAFHLHELSPERERELRAALESDPHLAAEANALAETLAAIKIDDEPAARDARMSDHHWQRLRPQLGGRPRGAFGWWKPFSLGTLCGLAIPCLFLFFHAAAPAPVLPTSPASRSAAGGSSPALATAQEETPGTGGETVEGGRRGVSACALPQPDPQAPAPLPVERMAHASEPLGPPLPLPEQATFDWREAPSLPSGATAPRPPVVTANGEEQESPVSPPPAKRKSYVRRSPFSLTAAAFGNLTVGRSALIAQSSASSSAAEADTVSEGSAPGALVSLEKPITRLIGVRLDAAMHSSTYSYTSGEFRLGDANFGAGSLQTRQYELAPSAVLSMRSGERVSPYVQVGAGMLVFVPHGNAGLTVHRAYRASGLVGAGVRVRLAKHLDLTAGYRGVIYRTPQLTYSFNNPSPQQGGFSVLVRRTLSSQPFVGFTYNFGRRGED